MKKIAVIALSFCLVSTAASAVVIDVTVDGATRRIDCGTQAALGTSGLPAADVAACQRFFETAAATGAGTGTGAGAGAAGAFGVGGAGTIALAGLGIALVAGFGGSSGGSSSNSTTN